VSALAWPLLAAALMPLLFTGIAKALGGGFDNRDPRRWQSHLSGLPQRAHAAHLNSFEAFPLFAVAVLFALLREVPADAILPWAWAFIGLRLLFGGLYLVNLATARSVAWALALGCAIRILFLAP
jgi:uncharacterized MAPEG superfamily protein